MTMSTTTIFWWIACSLCGTYKITISCTNTLIKCNITCTVSLSNFTVSVIFRLRRRWRFFTGTIIFALTCETSSFPGYIHECTIMAKTSFVTMTTTTFFRLITCSFYWTYKMTISCTNTLIKCNITSSIPLPNFAIGVVHFQNALRFWWRWYW